MTSEDEMGQFNRKRKKSSKSSEEFGKPGEFAVVVKKLSKAMSNFETKDIPIEELVENLMKSLTTCTKCTSSVSATSAVCETCGYELMEYGKH